MDIQQTKLIQIFYGLLHLFGLKYCLISFVVSMFLFFPLQIHLDVILHSICLIRSSFLKTDQAYSKMHRSNQYFKLECVFHIPNNVEILSIEDNCTTFWHLQDKYPMMASAGDVRCPSLLELPVQTKQHQLFRWQLVNSMEA